MTNESKLDPIETEWTISNPTCIACGSHDTRQLIIEARERTIIGEGDVVQDEFSSEYDLLEVRCSDCDELLYRSEPYAAYLRAERNS